MKTIVYKDIEYYQIPMCPEYYVSKEGSVYSTYVNRTLSTYITRGHTCLKLYNRSHVINRILAHTFLSLANLYDERYEVDHIDRNPQNNSLDNLQVLTIKEHKIKSSIDRGLTIRIDNPTLCAICGKVIYRTSTHCTSCAPIARNTPTTEVSEQEIIDLLKTHKSWVKAAKSLGISDNALRKRYKKVSQGKDPSLLKQLIWA